MDPKTKYQDIMAEHRAECDEAARTGIPRTAIELKRGFRILTGEGKARETFMAFLASAGMPLAADPIDLAPASFTCNLPGAMVGKSYRINAADTNGRGIIAGQVYRVVSVESNDTATLELERPRFSMTGAT